MSSAQIYDMLQRQVNAEGGCGDCGGEGYGLRGGCDPMGESGEGGARRRAKKAFPKSAKAGLCEYRLFQAQHKGLSRAEMSAKWAQHKAVKGGMMGGVKEFGDDVDGYCVYGRFRAEHEGIPRGEMKRDWASAKKSYFAEHPKGAALEGGFEDMTPEGGILSIRQRRARIRKRHPKASFARLAKLYDAARRAYYTARGKKAPKKRRSQLSRKSALGGHTISQLIELCKQHASSSGDIPAEVISAVVSHPRLSPAHAAEFMSIAESMPITAAPAIAEVAKAVEEEMKHGTPPVAPPFTPLEEGAAEHAASVVAASPEAALNPAAAKQVIKIAKPKRVISPEPPSFVESLKHAAIESSKRRERLALAKESGLRSAFNADESARLAAKAARRAEEIEQMLGSQASSSKLAAILADPEQEAILEELMADEYIDPAGHQPAGFENVYGKGLRGGRRFTKAQKATFLRKCMRKR